MSIINASFCVGQRYLGLVDKKVYQVSEIQRPGKYQTDWGGVLQVTSPIVHFLNEATGEICECKLELAQHLLLQKI